MAKTKKDKAAVIEKLEQGMKDATSSVFVHFSKLSVADETAMRRALKAQGVNYTVAKKTLIRRALEALGHKHDELPLEGEVAVAYGGGDDMTAPARLIHEAGQKLADKLSILGGIFEGKLIGQEKMREIATIPPLATLRAMFAQVINSPRQRLAVVLSAVAGKKN
jgi:large subunit ribosomal protein L10